MQYAQYGDRFRFQPEGLFGGLPGAPALCTIERNGELIKLQSKAATELRKGDILTVCTGGGAGYGPLLERPEDIVRADIEQGFISAAAAQDIYRHGA